jgi:integrase/recombinase XerD
VIRLADRESGLSAPTIARRLASVSGLYAYLVARGDMPVHCWPASTRPPRGGLGWHAGARKRLAPATRAGPQ